jgi:catechol 2,3-dioxygenase-like lactoylglutathione lyase family enzyme
MIGYVTLGTNDFDKATKFYDELFSVIGVGRVMEGDDFRAWSTSMDAPAISVIRPWNKEPATAGNGTMVAIAVDSKEKVHALHDKALELGGADEGAAGPRQGGFYAGYFRDLDGNKLNAFFFEKE